MRTIFYCHCRERDPEVWIQKDEGTRPEVETCAPFNEDFEHNIEEVIFKTEEEDEGWLGVYCPACGKLIGGIWIDWR